MIVIAAVAGDAVRILDELDTGEAGIAAIEERIEALTGYEVDIAVINARYPGGWLKAIAIALVAWLASIVVLYVLSALGLTAFEAVGVPGV